MIRDARVALRSVLCGAAVALCGGMVCSGAIAGGRHQDHPALTQAQKQIMVEAWQAGYHVGLPLAFTAVVYVESKFRCRPGDHGLARGCAQLHAVAVRAATGMNIPAWQYDLPTVEDVDLAIGARYFAQCIQRWGWPAGIAAYNTGPTIAAKLGRKRLAELPYTRAVLAAMVWLRKVPINDD